MFGQTCNSADGEALKQCDPSRLFGADRLKPASLLCTRSIRRRSVPYLSASRLVSIKSDTYRRYRK